MTETNKDLDAAGFSDSALQDVVGLIDFRTLEEREADERWITETTRAIIDRRKARQAHEKGC